MKQNPNRKAAKLEVLVTLAQAKSIRLSAKTHGVSVSAWLRMAALARLVLARLVAAGVPNNLE